MKKISISYQEVLDTVSQQMMKQKDLKIAGCFFIYPKLKKQGFGKIYTPISLFLPAKNYIQGHCHGDITTFSKSFFPDPLIEKIYVDQADLILLLQNEYINFNFADNKSTVDYVSWLPMAVKTWNNQFINASHFIELSDEVQNFLLF